MSIQLHVKGSLFLPDFNENLVFSTNFRKNTQISSFKKIRPVGAGLFHTERWTDMTKLIVASRKFANRLKAAEHPARSISNVEYRNLRYNYTSARLRYFDN